LLSLYLASDVFKADVQQKILQPAGVLVLFAAVAYVIRGKNLQNFLGVADEVLIFGVHSRVPGLSLERQDRHDWRQSHDRCPGRLRRLCVPVVSLFGLLAATYLVVYLGTRKLYLPGFCEMAIIPTALFVRISNPADTGLRPAFRVHERM